MVTKRKLKAKNRATGKRKKTEKSEVTQPRKNAFEGQDEAELVIRWMQDSKRPANDAVEQLINLEVRFRAGDITLGQERRDLVNEAVAKWKFGIAPQMSYDPYAGEKIVWNPTTDTRVVPPAQSIAFWRGVELMQLELLTRVRRCKREGCGNWHFAKFERAEYCSETCRVKALTGTKKFRERRKQYMKNRRKGGR